jgi:hypothetical protein
LWPWFTKARQVCRLPCGGGRRPYALGADPADPAGWAVAFVGEHGARLSLHAAGGAAAGGAGASPLASLRPSFHARCGALGFDFCDPTYSRHG